MIPRRGGPCIHSSPGRDITAASLGVRNLLSLAARRPRWTSQAFSPRTEAALPLGVMTTASAGCLRRPGRVAKNWATRRRTTTNWRT